MSESDEVLDKIRKSVKGRILLVGRRIGQQKFDALGAALRAEANPQKYLTGGSVIPWKAGLLREFAADDFDSIVLHRFLYKRVKDYVEDPLTVLSEAKRILPEGGVLVVNSYLFDDVTKNFRSANAFFTEEDMERMLRNQGFRKVSRVDAGNVLFVCEK